MPESLKQKTVVAFFWSAVQSWGVKFFALILFLLLAKFLSPEELGIASAVVLVLSFVAIVSEQGFIDAIVQNKNLSFPDLNIPFVISLTIAFVASIILYAYSTEIAHLIEADGAAWLIKISAIIPPLTAVSNLQIAMARRQLNFKRLANVNITATLLSGIVALIMAIGGYGALSLVVQVILMALFVAIFMWIKPIWKIEKRWESRQFKAIFSYSSHAFSSKILDFFSGRVIDLIILSKFGVVGLGIYTVGSKLYQTVLQLLASSTIDVALSAMSKIASEQEKLRRVYLKFIYLSSSTTLPLFIAIAATSDEICAVLFSEKWVGVSEIATWLSILGAIQVVQFFNGTVLGASGKARTIFLLNCLKFISGLVPLLALHSTSIVEVTFYYVLSQMLVAPMSFVCGMKLTGSSFKSVFIQMYPGVFSAAIAYAAVYNIKAYLSYNAFIDLILLLALYFVVYLVFLFALSGKKFISELRYIISNR